MVAGLAFLAATVLLFGPTLVWLFRSWRVHPYYAHGLVVPPLAAWLYWTRRKTPADGNEPPDTVAARVSIALVGTGAILALLAAPDQVEPVEAAALVTVLAGAAGLLGGRRSLKAAAFPAGLLLLAIPLPLVERIAPPLAADVASRAAGAAGLLGVSVVRAGAQLSVADGTFTVGAPCSGLRSVIALVTLAYLGAGFMAGTPARKALLVALAIPAALAANWLRLTGLLVATSAWGSGTGLAVFEGPASPMLFMLAAASLLVVARLMGLR